MSILKAIGASAVFCGVRALATAREYLASDGDEDIMVIPRFSKTILDGRDSETTVTELCVLPNRGEEDTDDMDEKKISALMGTYANTSQMCAAPKALGANTVLSFAVTM